MRGGGGLILWGVVDNRRPKAACLDRANCSFCELDDLPPRVRLGFGGVGSELHRDALHPNGFGHCEGVLALDLSGPESISRVHLYTSVFDRRFSAHSAEAVLSIGDLVRGFSICAARDVL